MKLYIIIGKFLCQGDSLEVAESKTLPLRQYGQPLAIIELGIKFCLSILFCKHSQQFYAKYIIFGIMAYLNDRKAGMA